MDLFVGPRKNSQTLSSNGSRDYNYHPDMTIFPRRSFAQTDQPVTIVRPNSLVKATGMTADLKKGLIHLLSDSQGVYEANANPPKKS